MKNEIYDHLKFLMGILSFLFISINIFYFLVLYTERIEIDDSITNLINNLIVVTDTFYILIFALYHYFTFYRHYFKLLKVLPEWKVYRKLCKKFDINTRELMYELNQSFVQKIGLNEVIKYFKEYKEEHEVLLSYVKAIEFDEPLDGESKEERIKTICNVFKNRHYNFVNTYRKSVKEDKVVKNNELKKEITQLFIK